MSERPNISHHHRTRREVMARQIAEFMARGGEIRQFPPGASGRVSGLPREFVNEQRRKAANSNKRKGGWS